jgi:Cu-Zn family superoxide dismutase
MRPALPAVIPLLMLAGCAAIPDRRAASPQAVSARADLVNGAGATTGSAEFARAPRGGVVIRVRASGLTPGEHGIHIHETGLCEGPAFTSAGSHLKRPGSTAPHGLRHPAGGEAGDLPNLIVNADGTAEVELVSASVVDVLGAPAPSVIGRAIVIHAKPDDQLTQPIGGSGDRIACGVIRPAR